MRPFTYLVILGDMKNTLLLLFLLSLFRVSEVSAQPTFQLVPLSRINTSYNTVTCTVLELEAGHYVYTAGDGNKIDVFKVHDDGKMEFITRSVVSGGHKSVRGLVTDKINGKDFLFAGLKGGSAVEVFEINPDGTLNSVFVMPDTDSTYLGVVITLQVIHMESASYLFVGGIGKNTGIEFFQDYAGRPT